MSKQQSTEGRSSSHEPPLKYCLQPGFNILCLHSYKVPLVKAERGTVQCLEMARKETLGVSSAVESFGVWGGKGKWDLSLWAD